MRALVLHRHAPGQFGPLAAHLARAGHDVAMLGQGQGGAPAAAPPGVRALAYRPHRPPGAGGHHYLREAEAAVLNGQAVARRLRELARGGWRPDLVLAHPGWGEALFVRDALPDVRLATYAEYYHRAEGGEAGFDAETALSFDARCALHLRNAPLLAALDAAHAGLSPTPWQRALHPAPYHPRIAVAHEGVDLAEVAPDPRARLVLDDGRVLTRADAVVSYVARDLEPVRGFHALMRALPDLLRRRPEAVVVVCGGDGVSYGGAAPGGGTWRAALLAEAGLHAEVGRRLHFTGWLDRARYLALLRVSRLHLYLSAPFVLSWSFTEALAAGCAVLAADTAPVREAAADVGGHAVALADPRVPALVAERAALLLADAAARADLSARARAVAAARFDRAACLEAQAAVLRRALEGG